METESKSKLTGGTLFVIALIVLIFGNAKSVQISEKVDKTNDTLSRIESQIRSLKSEVSSLKEENERLSEQLPKTTK